MTPLSHLPSAPEISASSFWLIDAQGTKILRDPAQEHAALGGFDWHTYCAGQGLDDLNYMYWENNDCYEFEAVGSDYERLGCIIEPGDVVVDIGSNIGIFARRALQRGASRVYSFEPSSRIFSCLLDNTPRDRVECHRLAVAGFNGATLLQSDLSTGIGGSSLIQDKTGPGASSERVLCVTLNRLFEWELIPAQIDFMKMDCEGAEVQILEDLSDSNLARIRKLALEFHTSVLGDEAREALVSRLAGAGFAHFTLFHGSGAEATLNFWRS